MPVTFIPPRLFKTAALATAVFVVLANVLSAAALAAPLVRGSVRDRASGAPIVGAVVRLEVREGPSLAIATTDRAGAFGLPLPSVGHYQLVAFARGYESIVTPLAIANGPPPALALTLAREGTLHEIGGIVARANSVAQAPAERSVAQDTLAAQGALRVSDSLAKLAGVTLSGDAAAPGGDAYLSLRGLRPGESQTLLDGHPIGPLGVQASAPDADGTIAGFNYQDAPYFALRDVNLTFGAGATELTGNDALAGTVDLRTFDPTRDLQAFLQQGLGTQGRAFTALRATGTEGKLGFALVHGVEGTYGAFPGETISQTGLRGTDFTSAALSQLSYHVSGDYALRNDLAKFVYAPAPGTKVAVSAYDATSWADKTGEGDNDFNPYAYTLANAPVGASPSCPHGVLVTTDAGPQCLSPGAYASRASGPAGGGPGAWQALRNQDYDGSLTQTAGAGVLAVDAFADQYALVYHRDASAASGPLDAFLDRWSTQGASLSDTFAGPRNLLGFGVAWMRETLDGDASSLDGGALVANAPAGRIDRSLFLRDAFAASPQLSLLFNAWLKASSDDPAARLEPRLTLRYQAAPSDAFRVTAGVASQAPALQDGQVALAPVGALNPDCGAIARAGPSAPASVDVGSGPASGLQPESGSDLELGYDHRFGDDSRLGLSVYDMNVSDRIVTGELAAGGLLPVAAVPALLQRIQQFCGLSPAPSDIRFTLNREFNAAAARVRGIELGGRARLTRFAALDYGFDVQSVVLEDLPAAVLRSDPTLVDGTQAFEVPLHKATLGLELSSRNGFLFRLDGHAVGPNNPQQLPGYAYADASLEAPVSKRVRLRLDAANVFNSHAQTYGLVGLGLPYATNAYNASLSSPFLQPFNERYGLQPASLTLSATLHL
jgi:outer membrane receptor protein involved in Fe transport